MDWKERCTSRRGDVAVSDENSDEESDLSYCGIGQLFDS